MHADTNRYKIKYTRSFTPYTPTPIDNAYRIACKVEVSIYDNVTSIIMDLSRYILLHVDLFVPTRNIII